MTELPFISIRVDGSMNPADCVALAKAADAAGLIGVWFAENAFYRGILPAAAACALATKAVRINAGVFNPYGRHPTMMAMEIGALAEIAPGRTSLSLGAGIMSATEKLGFNADKPLPALRDALTIVRTLLRGEEVNYVGPYFSAKHVKLDYPPPADIQVYVAGRGNLTVKLAGRAADGLIVSNMCSVDFAARSASLMQSSRKSAGRGGEGRIVQYMPCAVGTQSSGARAVAKRAVGEMLPRFWSLGQKLVSAKEALLAGTGIKEDEFASASQRIRAGEDAANVLDDRYVRAFSLAGTAEECLDLAATYKSYGIAELALTVTGPNAAEGISALGEAIRRRDPKSGLWGVN